MKASTISALLALALVATGGAYAAPQNEQGGDVVRVSAKSAYTHTSGELANYESTYRLDNGQTVRFSQSGLHFYAEVKGEPRSRMIGQAQGVFMTESGARIEFRDDGEALAISNFERMAPMARLGRDTTAYASR